eukprot:1177514-Prorocentrum_minimum.AAC.1
MLWAQCPRRALTVTLPIVGVNSPLRERPESYESRHTRRPGSALRVTNVSHPSPRERPESYKSVTLVAPRAPCELRTCHTRRPESALRATNVSHPRRGRTERDIEAARGGDHPHPPGVHLAGGG